MGVKNVKIIKLKSTLTVKRALSGIRGGGRNIFSKNSGSCSVLKLVDFDYLFIDNIGISQL